jgi:ribosomal protein S18 acetylase RimI-like enzyme
VLTLQPMGAGDFPAFFAATSESHARDNMESGRWSEADAMGLAQAELKRLPPHEEKTPENQLFVLSEVVSESKVGYLWYGTQVRGISRVAFLYQLLIHEDQRRKGYGRQALKSFERHALATGHDSLALNVFASNGAALRLYESYGFSPTSIGMRKRAGPQ